MSSERLRRTIGLPPRRREPTAVSLAAAWLCILASLALPGGASQEVAAPLEVCLREDDLPRSGRAGEAGFDVAVMKLVARQAGLELEPVWLPSSDGFSEIESSDLPLGALARGDCDAVGSVPGEAALGELGSELVLTRPYYGAGFELIGGPGLPAELAALGDLRVGVRLQSLAHFALQALGISWSARPTTAEVLQSLDEGRVDAALVWGPALALFGRAPLAGYEPPRALRFNEHIALRRGDPRFQRIDEALEHLLSGGGLADLAAESGLFYRAPFPTVSNRQALRDFGPAGDSR